MTRRHTAKGLLPAALLTLFLGGWVAAAPAAPAAEPSKADIRKVAKLLDGTGYKFVERKPGVWTVEFAGRKLGRSLVVVSATPKLVVMFTIVKPHAAAGRTPELMDTLLRANSTFDYVKIGFDRDGDVFVRLDAPSRLTDARQLKTDLEQVMSASDELYGEIAGLAKR